MQEKFLFNFLSNLGTQEQQYLLPHWLCNKIICSPREGLLKQLSPPHPILVGFKLPCT